MTILMDERQRWTILAALRAYQTAILDGRYVDHQAIEDIATAGWDIEKLTSEEVDLLCKAINLPATQIDYLANHGVVCPYCGATDAIEPSGDGSVYINQDGTAMQSIECKRCGRLWIDRYALLGFEPAGEDE